MKAKSGRLLACFLFFSLLVSSLSVCAGAAVRTDYAGASADMEKSMQGANADDALVTAGTEKRAPVDLSSATWKNVDGHLRLVSSDGNYVTGFATQNGKWYYFNSKGNLVTGFFTHSGKKYYASTNRGEKGKGQILTGLVRIGRHFYFLNPSSSPYPGVVSNGFQRIQGRRYYFDKKGHMVNGWFTVNGIKYYASCNTKGNYGALLTGVQTIGGRKYTFNSEGALLSRTPYRDTTASNMYRHMIDVSEHQGVIDFKKVKASGVRGVMIRAGYGDGHVDKYFHANITKAKAAGLPVGIYWFSYAGSKKKAISEARHCLRVIKAYKIDMPVYFDWEYDSMNRTKVKSRSLITDMTAAFCTTIIQGGHRAGYYFNLHYYNTYFNNSRLTAFSKWYAYWGTNKPAAYIWGQADTMKTPTRFDIWQFSSRGRISGISGYVDCDLLLHPSILK